jgi:hypothetical protein
LLILEESRGIKKLFLDSNLLYKQKMNRASGGGRVVEHSTHCPEVKGWNRATATGKRKWQKRFFLILNVPLNHHLWLTIVKFVKSDKT